MQIFTESSLLHYSIFAKCCNLLFSNWTKNWKWVSVMEMNVHVVTYVVIKVGVIFNSICA